MAINYGSDSVTNVIFNNQQLDKVIFNGVVVWQRQVGAHTVTFNVMLTEAGETYNGYTYTATIADGANYTFSFDYGLVDAYREDDPFITVTGSLQYDAPYDDGESIYFEVTDVHSDATVNLNYIYN